MRIINYTLLLSALILVFGCSNDSTEAIGPDNGNGNANTNSQPSDDISTLWIANFTMAAKGQRVAITNDRKVTVHGNSNYRTNLNLDDTDVIASISGGSYNKDGTYPTIESDMYVAYSAVASQRDRNNVTISFSFVDEANANAHLTIDSQMIFTDDTNRNAKNDIGHKIEKGNLTIKVKDERLNDAIHPLGNQGNTPYSSFKFNDVDIDGKNYNTLIYDGTNDATADFDVKYSDLVDMFKENGNKFPIKIIETAIVRGGERFIFQPPNFN